MRLLMTTQVIDPAHPILGFSHSWASKLAQRLEKLYVLTLYLGTHSLPSNVKVFSLGKEKGTSRLGRFLNFHRIVAPLIVAGEINGIFVQQTEINAILVAPYAKLWRIPLILFKAHSQSLRTTLRVANMLIDRALTSTPVAYPIDTPKRIVTGQGIDVDVFKPDHNFFPVDRKKIIGVGRLSPIKNYQLQIEAVNILVNQRGRRDCFLHIYGGPDPESYYMKLKKLVDSYSLRDYVQFEGPTDFRKMPDVYASSYAEIHTCDTESLDKVVLESMACGKPVITSIQSYRQVMGDHANSLVLRGHDVLDLAHKIEGLLDMPEDRYRSLGLELRDIVVRDHSLDTFADQVVIILENLLRNRRGACKK